jgi:hypothetical protein
VTPQEAVAIATDADIDGDSLLTTDITRLQMSNVAKDSELQAPLNRFLNVKRYPLTDKEPSILNATWTPPVVKRIQ